MAQTWGVASSVPIVLAIGGLDPSGGAGLPADARAAAAFGAHCCGVATAVIAQNTRGVARVEPVPADMLAHQLDNLLEDITPAAVKIGMVPGAESMRVIALRLQRLLPLPIIIDPVLAPSHGAAFLTAADAAYLIENLMPLAELVTPNIPEAVSLCGEPVADRMAMRAALPALHVRCGAPWVLLKGGHLPAMERVEEDATAVTYDMIDLLYDGATITELRGERVAGGEVRGTGCLLAAAIAAQRARGVPMLEAARRARAWLTLQIARAQPIGQGSRVAL